MPNEVKLPTAGPTTNYRVGHAMLFIGDLFTANAMGPVSIIEGPVRIAAPPAWDDLQLPDNFGPNTILERALLDEALSATVPLVNDRANTLRTLLAPSGHPGYGASGDIEPAYSGAAIIPRFEIAGGLKTIQGAWHRDAGFGRLASPATTVTVDTGGAAQDATTVPVVALPAAVPSGTYLHFLPGSGKLARTTALAAASATSLSVEPLPVALVAADVAYVSGADAAPKHALFMWRCTFETPDFDYTQRPGTQIQSWTVTALHSFEDFIPEFMKKGVPGDPVQLGFPADRFHFSAPT